MSTLKNMSDTHLWVPLTCWPPAIGYILNNALRFTLSHNAEALSNSASTLILHLLFLGQNESQHVLCVNHPQTDVLHIREGPFLQLKATEPIYLESFTSSPASAVMPEPKKKDLLKSIF